MISWAAATDQLPDPFPGWPTLPRDCITLVYRSGNHPVGFLVYRLLHDELQIERLWVAEDHRRRGIGSALVRRVSESLGRTGTVVACVPESCLPAQILLRSCGFTAREILHSYFPDEDGYLFSTRPFPPHE